MISWPMTLDLPSLLVRLDDAPAAAAPLGLLTGWTAAPLGLLTGWTAAPLGLLTGWPDARKQELLQLALAERSIAGVQLAAASGAVGGLSDDELSDTLTSVALWCAPRSLRFRVQSTLIGGRANETRRAFLRDDPASREALTHKLLDRLPTLKPRGASMLQSVLADHVRRDAEGGAIAGLEREEVATRLQDGVAIAMCSPFLRALVTGGGRRPRLDVAHLAAVFATMHGGEAVLAPFVEAAYTIEHAGTDGGYAHCLSCPQCCLANGIKPTTSDGGMWFSPAHAAAASGQGEVLAWLEARGVGEARGGSSLQRAREMVFSASTGAAIGDASEPADLSDEDGGGWRQSASANVGVAGDSPPPGDSRCDFEVVEGRRVVDDPVWFYRTFVLGAKPVLVRRLMQADPALAGSTSTFSRHSLLERMGSTVWDMGSIPYQGRFGHPTPPPASMAEYVTRHIDGCAAGDVCSTYIFSDRFKRDGKETGVMSEGLTPTPSWVESNGVRPTREAQFYLGGPHSGAPMHYHLAAYNLLVYGHKLWLATPPASSVFSMRPAHEWLGDEANASGHYRCEQRPGDMLVLPDVWGHLTYNLQTSVGFAQEFNYELREAFMMMQIS